MDTYEQKQKLLKGSILGIIIVFIILIIVAIVGNLLPKPTEPQDIGIGDEQYETRVLYENREIISSFLNNRKCATLLTEIEKYLLQDSQISKAPKENTNNYDKLTYVAHIESNYSYNKENSLLYDISMSDGRFYNLYIKTDGTSRKYIATFIRPTNINTPSALYLYAYDDSYSTEVENWIKTIDKNNPTSPIFIETDLLDLTNNQ